MTSDEPGELLPWDSEFFGLRIGRVAAPRPTRAELRRVCDWAHREAVDCVYYLADADDAEGVRAAEDAGFRLTDLRVTLARPLSELDARSACGDEPIDGFEPGDVASLAEIARASHRDSRFYADPHFPRERCDALYETWLRNSCEGWADAVLVARHAGRPAGYISCHRNPDRCGQIGLVAVADAARGRALGPRLVAASLRWFAARGLERAAVVTQGRNAAALRLYEKLGFRTESVRPWLHLWPGRSPPGAP